jgi:allantoinase
MKVYPPVKRKEDRETLWDGLREGVISFVSSDHAPHTIEEKQGDLFSIPAGMCGVESTLPLMLNEVSRGTITLPFVIQKLAENPAKLFNLYPNKGSLEQGADADIVIVDLSLEGEIRNEKLHSKNPLTAFHGTKIKGWPVATFLRGKQIARNGQMIGEPRGQFVKPIKHRSQN